MTAIRAFAGSLMLVASLAAPLRAQDSAAVAWRDGDVTTAERLYAARLAADSNDVRALHRLGLMFAWSERYGASLALFDRLAEIAPRNLEARVDRARVLAWAGRLPEATDALTALLAEHPDHRPALVELARYLTWRDRNDSARLIYDAMLQRDPADRDALQGRARATAWSGDLVAGEAEWRRALAVDSTDVAALIGLAQTLRWQGRPAAARETLERIDPDRLPHRDVDAEQRYLRPVFEPHVAIRLDYEGDSDDNRIRTVAVQTAWRPRLRIEVGLDAYVRRTTQDEAGVLAQGSRGATATVRAFPEPGWTAWLGTGVSGLDGSARDAVFAFSTGISTPGGFPIGASLSFQRRALDATAVLIDRGITFSQFELSGRAEPMRRWSVAAGLSRAVFSGIASNRRIAGYLGAYWRHSRAWRFGTRLRAFGFREDLQEGYFDPSSYWITEAIATWRRERDGMRLELELAPGLQRIGPDGSVQSTARIVGGFGFEPIPGMGAGFSMLYTSSAGLQTLATGGEGYRYFVARLSASLVF